MCLYELDKRSEKKIILVPFALKYWIILVIYVSIIVIGR